MGIQCYTLLLNVDHTLFIEILNADYQLWHKAQVSVDRDTSQGLTIGNVSVRKFNLRYINSKNLSEFMYYHRLIINFRKTASSHPYFSHLLVNIPQVGTDLGVYPQNWTENYIIAYDISGSVGDIDADKTYDYHTAFEIKPSKMRMNVPLDMKNNLV